MYLRQRLQRLAHNDDEGGVRTKSVKRVRRPKKLVLLFSLIQENKRMNHLVQINISKGGVPKLPVEETFVTTLGLHGDKQKDKRYHGGVDRAVCLFSTQIIAQLQNEGHPIYAGSTGENLTIAFENYHDLKPGVILQIGDEVQIQIMSYAAPCKTIKQFFLNELFIRISQKLYPQQSRLYAKVLKEGSIRKGDSLIIKA